MLNCCFGGKTGSSVSLKESMEHIVVRTASRMPLIGDNVFAEVSLSSAARALVKEFHVVARFEEAGVDILRVNAIGAAKDLRDQARTILMREKAVEFAGCLLTDEPSGAPFVYTENFFVKFYDEISPQACVEIITSKGLEVKRGLGYAHNAYFLSAPKRTGQKIFAIAEGLLAQDEVEFCHPELIGRRRSRQAFPQQWHLKQTQIADQVVNQHANVEAAWELSDGKGTIIAVIDDGIDLEHEEFSSPGKIVAPRDTLHGNDNPRPRGNNKHGNACAGIACADGNFGAAGVAPRAQLMPIRFGDGQGSQTEADAIHWAAEHGADVISCSWGPEDGDFRDESDPLHHRIVHLPDSTREAIDFATEKGRDGRGCVVCFAAGNGNESVDNDRYASYPRVIAVAACDDTGKRAPYSDFGRAIWCCFPSDRWEPSITPGIWTTDRSRGAGYNRGRVNDGDAGGNYFSKFGGTSAACPGAAGVAALVISRNPSLRWDEVKDILRKCCDRIDQVGGNYNAEGHSTQYGYGRLNARRAVELARPR